MYYETNWCGVFSITIINDPLCKLCRVNWKLFLSLLSHAYLHTIHNLDIRIGSYGLFVNNNSSCLPHSSFFALLSMVSLLLVTGIL